ncbi:MAG TPA: hypothetical protein VF615_17150 [Longimicrobiaceae bacterium]
MPRHPRRSLHLTALATAVWLSLAERAAWQRRARRPTPGVPGA